MSAPQIGVGSKVVESPLQRWDDYNEKSGDMYRSHYVSTQTGSGADICDSCYDKPKDIMAQQFAWEQYSKFGAGAGQSQSYRSTVQQGPSQSIFDTAQTRFSPANQSANINF